MTDTNPPVPATPDQPTAPARPLRSSKKPLLIGGALVAALAIGGAIATPSMVHASRVSAYEAAVTETVALQEATHELEVQADANERLAATQLSQAHALQGQLAGIAKTTPPALAAEQATLLAETATALGDALPEATGEQQEAAAQIATAQKAVKGAGFPSSWIGSTPEKLLEVAPTTLDAPAEVEAVASAEVTAEAVTAAEEQLAGARSANEAAQDRLDAATTAVDDIEAAVAAALPALTDAAESLPAAANAVIQATPKAGDGPNAAVTGAAQAAADFAAAATYTRDDSGAIVPAEDEKAETVEVSEPLRAVLTHRKVKAYIDAAAAAGKAHTETVQREEAEAAAAAAAQAQAEAEAAAAAQWAAQQQYSAPAPQYGGGGGGGYSAPAPAPAPPVTGGGGGGSAVIPRQGGDGVCFGNCYL